LCLAFEAVHSAFNKMLSYRRALHGALVLAKMENWNWETVFYWHDII